MSSTRAALYLRVSTGRQADHDLSIPDQRNQTQAWVTQRGWTVVAEYTEPGASATDDKRPEFQRMIERACDSENAFDVIVVHSFSRFFRDAFGLEFYVRKLAKHGVRLVSMTQELGDDPAQVMMRQVIALFDEYQSKENAKHVLRAMKENDRQGFWNGSRPPFGYSTLEAERRGVRVKKKLAVDSVEAEVVLQIFRLVLEGHNGSGPMGIKAIVIWLNMRGYTTRTGGSWGVGRIHALLCNPVYAGRLRFNVKDSRTHRLKGAAEHVYCDAPPIINHELFDRVQALLRSRNPRNTSPRVVTGPILLTGCLRLLWWEHDATDRHITFRQSLPVLFLQQLPYKGQDSVFRALDAHGSTGSSGYAAHGGSPSARRAFDSVAGWASQHAGGESSCR